MDRSRACGVNPNAFRWSVPAMALLLVTVGCGGEGPSQTPPPDRQDAAQAAGTAPGSGPPAADRTLQHGGRASSDGGQVICFSPGPDVQTALQEELILAEPGDVIQLEKGVFHLTSGLSLDVENVTIRGRGMDKTILSFKNQQAGAEGLYISSNGVTVEDLAIEDTKGNAIKSHTADRIIYRRVRTEWTGGPQATNGAYGIYPVSSKQVLIEECVAIAASDAGIYVGQSQDAIIRGCRAEYNVAGIEIENCYRAEAYGNIATRNTGGILVFDLPDLPQQGGHDIRVYNNKVYDNNTENFAPKGNMVASVPTGTGLMVMASTNVELLNNEVRDHGTVNVIVTSYLSTGIKIKDPNYVPYPTKIHIHHNIFGPCGDKPSGTLGQFMALAAGTPLPDIVWDGVIDASTGDVPVLSIHNNEKLAGEVTFAGLGAAATLEDPSAAQVQRDVTVHSTPLPAVPAVKVEGIE